MARLNIASSLYSAHFGACRELPKRASAGAAAWLQLVCLYSRDSGGCGQGQDRFLHGRTPLLLTRGAWAFTKVTDWCGSTSQATATQTSRKRLPTASR